MKKPCAAVIILLLLACCRSGPKNINGIIGDYIDAWKKFYPTEAFNNGDRPSAFRFEDFSDKKVRRWVDFNENTLKRIERIKDSLTFDDRIDADQLARRSGLEIERWVHDEVLKNSSHFYYDQVSGALTYILVRHNFSLKEKRTAVLNRLSGIRKLCRLAEAKLENGRPVSTELSLGLWEDVASFFEKDMPEIAKTWMDAKNFKEFHKQCAETVSCIRSLILHIKSAVIPEMTLPDGSGREDFARKLRIFTLMDISPERLSEIALDEFARTKTEFQRLAEEYLRETESEGSVPASFKSLMERITDRLEAHRAGNTSDFLNLYRELAYKAERFVLENRVATVPFKRTFVTELSPQHLARWGGVFWSGAFDPDAVTLFYITWISDDAPEAEKEAFYRRYNIPLVTVLITHELFPGHYLQGKFAAHNPRIMRSLFFDDLYAEGWATFSQKAMLDAGWAGNDKLVLLANLRTLLRTTASAINAVKIHCGEWDIDRAAEFAEEYGLVSPLDSQFLKYRIMNYPFLTLSYFLGYRELERFYESERERLGEAFNLQEFMDKILEAGTVPMYAIPEILSR